MLKHAGRVLASGNGDDLLQSKMQDLPLYTEQRSTPMIVRNRATEFRYTHNFIEALFAEDMHTNRIYSLANATLGVMTNASLAVSTFGHGLASARRGEQACD
jgi:hypothetical protein